MARAKTKAMCRVGQPLTAGRRAALAPKDFGLPEQRKYPINDLGHARNAKARSAQQFNAGNLTRAEFMTINRRADRVIRACGGGNPHGGNMRHNPNNNPMSAGTITALWIGGAVLGAGVVGGLAWWAIKKREEEAMNGAPGEPPRPPVPAGPIPPIPTLPVPVPTLPPEGEPPPEGEAIDAAMPPVVPGIGGQAHGVRASLADQAIVVVDQQEWLDYAGAEVEAINVEEWTSQQIMDRIWEKTFPFIGANLSLQPGWTVNGQPYEELTARGQEFIDGLLAGDITVPRNFPGHLAFARIMAGEVYTPLRLFVEVPENPSIWDLWQRDKAGVGLHHVLVKYESKFEPALGQHSSKWVWFVWPPGVDNLTEANSIQTFAKATRNQARQAAFDFVDSYAIASADVAENG